LYSESKIGDKVTVIEKLTQSAVDVRSKIFLVFTHLRIYNDHEFFALV